MMSLLVASLLGCMCPPTHEATRLLVPPALYAIDGVTMDVYLDNLSAAANYASYTWDFTGVSGSLGATKWSYTPSGTGTYDLSVQMYDASVEDVDTATLYVSSSTIAATNAVLAGDSLTDNNTYADELRALTGVAVTYLGTGVTDGATAHEGHAGQYWCWFAAADASPMTSAINTINIPAYVAAIGATPDVVVWQLGINAVYTGSLTTIDTTINTELACADQLIAAWQAAYPAVIHGIVLVTPGSDDDSDYNSAYSYPINSLYTWVQKRHRENELMVAHWGGQVSNGIYLVPANVQIDRANYPVGNPLHPTTTGYQQIAAGVRAWLAYVR